MKSRLLLFPLSCICLLFISATCIEGVPVNTAGTNMVAVIVPAQTPVKKAHKLNFLQKLVLKFYLKKNKLAEDAKADKLAKTSLLLGIAACGFLVLGLFIPPVILGTIPAGIAAMITGGSALNRQTKLIGKAKTGKGLGLGALIAFGVVVLAAALIIAAWFGGWN
jgi:hypothetical protein